MKTILILPLILMLSCAAVNQATTKTIKFSDGKTGKITFEAVSESNNDLVLNVSFVTDDKVRKESDVNRHVQEIWDSVRGEAEKLEIREGLIRYEYLSSFDKDKNKPVYEIILYETEKTESGRWTILKVN